MAASMIGGREMKDECHTKECARCGKPGSARQQIVYADTGEVLCYLCGMAQCAELATEGHGQECDCVPCMVAEMMPGLPAGGGTGVSQ